MNLSGFPQAYLIHLSPARSYRCITDDSSDFAHNAAVSLRAVANVHSPSLVFSIPVCSGGGLAERQVHIRVLCF